MQLFSKPSFSSNRNKHPQFPELIIPSFQQPSTVSRMNGRNLFIHCFRVLQVAAGCLMIAKTGEKHDETSEYRSSQVEPTKQKGRAQERRVIPLSIRPPCSQ